MRLSKLLSQVVLPVEVGFSEDSLAPRHTPLAAPCAVVWAGARPSVIEEERQSEWTRGQVTAEYLEVQERGLDDPCHKSMGNN